MEDIVKAALEQNKNAIADQTETDNGAEVPPEEFGPPVCAVLGCGAAGIERASRVSGADHSVGVAVQRMSEKHAEAVDTVISATDSSPPQSAEQPPPSQLPIQPQSTRSKSTNKESSRVDFETDLQNIVGEADIVAVSLDLDEQAIGRLVRRVCPELRDDQTVIAVPTIPQEGLTTESRGTFRTLVDAADTTVPYDMARITDALSSATLGRNPSQQGIGSILTTEWIEDVFEAFQTPLAGPPIHREPLLKMLNSGGVSMLYWGWGARQEDWEKLVSHAASHRVSDGDRRTADCGFGFVRFGETFTKQDFDDLRAASAKLLRHDRMQYNWLVCGDTNQGLGEKCRLAILLTGVKTSTLPYI